MKINDILNIQSSMDWADITDDDYLAEQSDLKSSDSEWKEVSKKPTKKMTTRPSTYTNETSNKNIKCNQCRSQFVWTSEEQMFYAENKFDEPKRCKDCRNNNKQYGKPPSVERKKRLNLD